MDPTSDLATFSGKEKEGVLRMLREHHKDARESNFELNKANPVSPPPTRKGTGTPNPTGARKRKLSKKASTGRNGNDRLRYVYGLLSWRSLAYL